MQVQTIQVSITTNFNVGHAILPGSNQDRDYRQWDFILNGQI